MARTTTSTASPTALDRDAAALHAAIAVGDAAPPPRPLVHATLGDPDAGKGSA
jgi:hypothetical protein